MGGLGGLPIPLVAFCAGGACVVPGLALSSSLQVAVGFFGFAFFLFFIYFFFIFLPIIRPDCMCVHLFLVFIVSLYFVAGEDVCPGASTTVPTAKGPRPQVRACLMRTQEVHPEPSS